jgi:hypothetical protein
VSIGVPKLGTFKVSNFILGNVQAMVTAQRSVVTMTPQVAKAAMDPSSETQFVLQEDPQFWTNSKVSKLVHIFPCYGCEGLELQCILSIDFVMPTLKIST